MPKSLLKSWSFNILQLVILTNLSFRFARYFDVECRLVPVSETSKYRLDPKRAMDFIDENTIGVFLRTLLFSTNYQIIYN